MSASTEEQTSNDRQQSDSRPDLVIAMRTLIAGGFMLEGADRNPGYVLLHMSRLDEFGATHHYCFALSEGRFRDPQIAAAQIAATHRAAQLILIGQNTSNIPTVVISGAFPHESDTLATRSQELLAECGVPLVFLTAANLAEIIELLTEHPKVRRAINWPQIFVEPVISPQRVRAELDAIQ